ncbi:ECF transporter S component [Oscillibacter hominis]|uniref:ECF transporter S component n=2 Tax=Oscillibacter hominis TaxID=2763056 RepID=A0A7G9B4A1_9FIRM|nr:ECF transporter S component [Oscillibacter hominis]
MPSLYFFAPNVRAIQRREPHMNLKKLTVSALMLALCMVLPFLTGQIPQIGSMLLPMHLPVLLCGFLCGWPYGLAVGFIAPLLRFAMFGMPPIFPTGMAMAFELAAYGAFTGVFYQLLPKKTGMLFVSLILAMAAGRVVWGIAECFLLGLGGFTWAAFVSGAFLNAIPGIILQIVLIPAILIALRKGNLMLDE